MKNLMLLTALLISTACTTLSTSAEKKDSYSAEAQKAMVESTEILKK